MFTFLHRIRLKWTTVIPLGACLLLSCMREQAFEPETVPSEAIPLNIEGAIDQVHTKVNASGFVGGDAIGLYAVNYEENNTVAGTLVSSGNQADNAKFVFDESTYKWTPIRPVYFKNINTNVDIYAYYPYASGISDVVTYGFEVQKDQSAPAATGKMAGYEASDFLWGKVANVAPTEKTISVKLYHRLAAVHVILQEGSGFAEGEYAALEKFVSVLGTTRKAAIDFSTGVATPVGGPQADGIVMASQEDGSFRAVIIPQSVEGGSRLFAITIGTQSYYFSQDAATAYPAGKMTEFTIRISKKSASGQYELELADTQIVDWTEDRLTHGGEARQYYVVNVPEPGTLGRTIKAAKKNPDKIRNLKVTGTVTTEDFYFMRDSMAILEAVNMKESRVVHVLMNDAWNEEDRIYEDDVIPTRAFVGKKTLYFYTFPENIVAVGKEAFAESSLSGPLHLPDDCKKIGECAFDRVNLTSLVFGSKLEVIEGYAFYQCESITGTLLLPESLKEIGPSAFYQINNLSGPLHLPESLQKIGNSAFAWAGHFDGNLSIPSGISSLDGMTFASSTFTGSLIFNNLKSFGNGEFAWCEFTGELVLPDNLLVVPESSFISNRFTRIIFPDTIKSIEASAFFNNSTICEPIVIPEDCIIIKGQAFDGCSNIPSIEFPEKLQTIQTIAFRNCFGVTKMICHSVEPPTVMSGAFDGVGKDNLTLEVPEQSLIRYQTESGWSEFKRISGYQDFSVSRRMVRALNAGVSNTYVLRAPSGLDWSIESKPDWVTVSPASGTGKAEITLTVSEMARTDETFDREVWERGYYVRTDQCKGRAGEVVFLLNDKDYRFNVTVEQYDCDANDGDVQALQTAAKGNGIDIVLTGDCYDALDIASGTFLEDMENAYTAFFDIEPYKTYKDYFNVYVVYAMSKESGIGTVNTIRDSKFGSTLSERILLRDQDGVFQYALKSPATDLTRTLVILVANTSVYEGITYIYGDGSAIALCPKSTEAYPYDFRGIVQHEAGGHGFGKLADEYIYHNAFITDCSCGDGCDHGDFFHKMKALNWFRNLEFTGDMHKVGWSHLIFHPKYSDKVDVYEGGYMHNRGVFRSEPVSCMNNNIPYYSAISRQAMVERIMELAGEEFTLEKFMANDSFAVGAVSAKRRSLTREEMDGTVHYSHDHGPVYMGEHPNVK